MTEAPHQGDGANSERPNSDEPAEDQGPVVRDKRRIDPATGEVRTPAADPVTALEEELADIVSSDLQRQVDERTADVQRLQAEFANYRRRVERDRQAVGEQALGS